MLRFAFYRNFFNYEKYYSVREILFAFIRWWYYSWM